MLWKSINITCCEGELPPCVTQAGKQILLHFDYILEMLQVSIGNVSGPQIWPD